ncbi:hypothetical protein KUTeg_011597 [Tegillarca granosa]|uniref:Uncharacterized protein n=1 Tax=Tegillarca granosa TaxID=220873 RepID=A0ABQ9F1I3_TEGGR|nr:hypothetical protein KUTeg_011597 [Tegillarca granosa]
MSVLSTENFSETGPRSLDLFSVPPTQTAIEKIIFEEVRPISQITGNAPIEFIISGQNESKLVDMEGQIFHDLFNLDRYILNQVAIGVKLYRSKPEFCLITNENQPAYEVVIEDIILKVAKVIVSPSVIYGHAEVLKHTNAKYPYTKTEVKMMTIPSEATGKWLHDSDNGLTRKSISGGYALYCYTIEPNFGDDGNYLTLLKQGNVRLEATFGTALAASTTCIVYAEYPGYFEISASRDIILE